jgi:hypothetical protein
MREYSIGKVILKEVQRPRKNNLFISPKNIPLLPCGIASRLFICAVFINCILYLIFASYEINYTRVIMINMIRCVSGDLRSLLFYSTFPCYFLSWLFRELYTCTVFHGQSSHFLYYGSQFTR